MNILYLDPIGGIAGDMFLSALLDTAKEEDEKESSHTGNSRFIS